MCIGELAPAANEFIFTNCIKPKIHKGWDVTYIEYQRRGLETFPEEIPRAFDWMDRHRRDPYPKAFADVSARTSDDRFYGVVVREFSPGHTTAPEAADVFGKNLNPAEIRMTSSSLSNLIRLDLKGVRRLDLWLSPKLVDFKRTSSRSGSRAGPTPRARIKLDLESIAGRPPPPRRPAAALLDHHGSLRHPVISMAHWIRHSRPAASTAMESPVTDPQTPDWVRDAIFYQIFPDRFARSVTVPKPRHLDEWGAPPTYHGYQGGDLIGVVEHLDYLVDLGINALYFTPIFQSASNHRYHTHDYEKVDPMLGGNAALRRLLDEAHARGIRVVLDGVFNHASRGFFPFHDIMENGPDSAYLDWFTVKEFPLYAYDSEKAPNYQAWWGLPALPKFNTDCPEVREFLWGIGRKWMEFGIDGWRLDVPNEIDDDDFWREFRRRVRAVNPEATSSARSGSTPRDGSRATCGTR